MTPKQEQFVKEYLIDLNATQAAIRAGYSAKTAGQQAEQLLKKLEIAEAVQIAMDERSERTEITADYVLLGIKDVVTRAKVDNEKQHELKGYELLGKHLELFTDKMKHSGNVTLGNALDALEQGDD